jgi:hypothetical protein
LFYNNAIIDTSSTFANHGLQFKFDVQSVEKIMELINSRLNNMVDKHLFTTCFGKIDMDKISTWNDMKFTIEMKELR